MNNFYKKAFFVLLGIMIALIATRFMPSLREIDFFGIGKSYDGKVISWREAGKYIGKTCEVEGRIVATYNAGKVCFLNFDRDYKKNFTVVIFQSAFNNFPSPPETLYKNKLIKVKGYIKEYKGKPEIIVNYPSEIEILE